MRRPDLVLIMWHHKKKKNQLFLKCKNKVFTNHELRNPPEQVSSDSSLSLPLV